MTATASAPCQARARTDRSALGGREPGRWATGAGMRACRAACIRHVAAHQGVEIAAEPARHRAAPWPAGRPGVARPRGTRYRAADRAGVHEGRRSPSTRRSPRRPLRGRAYHARRTSDDPARLDGGREPRTSSNSGPENAGHTAGPGRRAGGRPAARLGHRSLPRLDAPLRGVDSRRSRPRDATVGVSPASRGVAHDGRP